MLPISILLLTIEQGGRKAMSIAETGLDIGSDMTVGNIINWVLVLVLALVLSVIRRKSALD